MKSLLTVLLLGCSIFAALGQGTVNFVNKITGSLDAPIFDTDGVTRLSGAGFRAQLYGGPVGTAAASLAAVGASLPFRTGAGAGYVDSSSGSARTIPGVAENGTATIQVRAWDATKGATYEAALAAGGKTGVSTAFNLATGGGLNPPTPLTPLRSFQLQLSSPPAITIQPLPVTTGIGGTASFTVTAVGAPTITFQWLKNGSAIPGATSSTLPFNSVVATDAATYSVRVTNPFGSVTSANAALTVAPLPTIAGVTVNPNPPLVGRALRMDVTVTGTGPFTYQWQLNNSDLPGATLAFLERSSAEAGTFAVKITGPGGTVRRDVTTVVAQFILTLNTARGGSATVSPSQASYPAGTRVTLSAVADAGYAFGGWSGDLVSADNPATLTMDGHKTVTPLFGATGGTVNFVNRITGTLDAPVRDIDGVTLLDDRYRAALYGGPSAGTMTLVGPPVPFRSGVAAGYFTGEERAIPTVSPGATAFLQVRAWRASDGATFEAALAAGGRAGESVVFTVVTGNAGSPPSLPAVLAGLRAFQLQTATPPRIVTQPVPVLAGVGGTARFEVVAAGSPPLTYQWRKGNSNIGGATSASHTIPNVSAGDAGSYSVRVSNAHGFIDSAAAALTIAPLPTIAGVTVNPNPPQFGRALRMEVSVTGTGPFTYQWLRSGTPIAGATTSVLDLAAADPGTYTVHVTGPGGTTQRDVTTVVAQYTLTLESVRGGTVTASPSQATYAAGTQVTLTAVAEPGYEFSGWTGDLSGAVNPSPLVMSGHRTVGAAFRTTAGTVNFVNLITGVLDAPVFDIDGVTKLDDRYVAALYAGTSSENLVQAGASTPFRSGVGVGYFPGSERVIPGITGGMSAFIQVRAWRIADGATHEAAVAAGGKVGESTVFQVITGNAGSPPTLPAVPLGLTSFRLHQGAPPEIASTTATPNPPVVGRTLRLEVSATGAGPLSYAWFLGTTPIPGATAAILDIPAAAIGTYSVRVTGPGGTTTRDVVTVVEGFVLNLDATRGGTLIANPARASYASGASVSIEALADPGYEFAGFTGDLSGTVSPATVVMNGHKSVGAQFRPTGGTVNFVNLITGSLDAPVFDTDGSTKLGSGFVAQLYAGPTVETIAAVGAPIAFRTGVGVGYFPGEERAIPSVAPGQTARVQVRAWRLADGSSYEAAVVAGGRVGASPVLSVVTGNAGSPPSLPALLSGLASFQLQVGAPPTIVRQPVPISVALGATARFEVGAAGLAPLTYQWRKGGVNIPGATDPIYEKAGVSASDAGDYSARVSNSLGTVDSAPARLTILEPTAITRIIVTGAPVAGRPLKLEVLATGALPLAYQWFRDSTAIPGGTAAVLDLASADAGVYSVRVSGPGGAVTQVAATVTVQFALTLNPGRGGKIVPTPAGSAFDPGTSVSLRPEPEPGYEFTAWSGDLSGSTTPGTIVMNGHKTVAAAFRATGGTINFANRITGIVNAPIFDLDGLTLLDGPAFLAQLYAGPSAQALAPVGPPLPFRTGIAAGFFPAEERSIPTVPPGGRAFVQVRAWESAAGDTFDEAVAGSGKVGLSTVFSVTTGNQGSPPSLPAFLVGLNSFKLELGRPPEVTTPPVATTAVNGRTAQLSVVAIGIPLPQYQWIRNGIELPGATAAVLSFDPVRPADTGLYSVRVRNPLGEVVTTPVQLTVIEAPAIVSLSAPAPVLVGDPVSLTVVASGTAPLSYQWYQGPAGNTDNPVGPDAPAFTSAPLSGPASFWVRVRNAGGSVDSAAVSVVVNRRPQTIAFAALPPVTFGGTPVTLSATASSGLPVVFTLVSGPATLAAGLVTPTGAGDVRLRASQPGDAVFLPAPDVEQAMTVGKGTATIALAPLDQVFDGTPRAVLPTTVPAGLPVGLTYNGVAAAPVNAGAYTVAAVVNHANYTGSVTRTLTVAKAPQTISFALASPRIFSTTPIVLVATASSGLPVSFERVSGPANLAGPILTLTGAGTVVVRAVQPGDANRAEAPAVEQTLVVTKAPATVTLGRLDQTFDGTPKAVSVTVDPAGLTTRVTYDGAPLPPSAEGTYAVSAVVEDPNFTGSASGTLRITAVVSIAGTVFDDLNSDGVRNGSEAGLPSVGVLLFALDGTTELRATTTDAAGAYELKGVPAGSYYLLEQNPADYTSTTPDLRLISVSGEAVTEVNFGDQRVGTVTGVVYEDLDGDGGRDETERGLGGVAIRLIGGGTTRTAATLADGSYQFSGVTPGTYTVEETDPAGFASTTPNLRSVSVAPGGAATASFGDQAVGTIGGVVFADLNANGVQDVGEAGMGGVTIRLTGGGTSTTQITRPDGSFLFTSLGAGLYTVEETDPTGFTSTTPNLRSLSLSGGGATANFGDQPVGAIGGVVYEDRNGNGAEDSGEPGIPGVTVRLAGATGQVTTVTTTSGAFQFSGIAPGTYTVEETDPSGFISTTPNTRSVILAAGASVGVSFGDQPAGTVSGTVFHDLDGNGLRDPNEPGIGGVAITLVDGAGQRTTTTSGDGAYLFTFVSPGSYTVEETDPLGYSSTTPNSRAISVASGGSASASFGDQAAGTIAGAVFEDTNGDGTRDSGEAGIGGVAIRLVGTAGQRTTATSGDGSFQFPGTTPGTYTLEEIDPVGFSSTTPNTRTVSLASGGSANASFGDQAAGSVGGVVYEDINGNGRQEPGEPGLNGVTLRLLGTAGQRSAVTGGDGRYQFTAVIPGAYSIEETDPAGYSSTTPNVRSITLGSGGSASANFGDQAAGTLAGMVFADANGNGLRDSGEAGIGGVTIRATGPDGTRTAFTAGDGTYQFAALVPGSYGVEETDPVGFVSTTPNLRAVSLTSGGSGSASFGDQPVQTIAGVVFEDTNGNGRADAGEPGIGGVSLRLLRADDDTLVRETTTSGDGLYVFADVPAGAYLVRQTVPSSYTVLAVNGLPSAPALQAGEPAPDSVTKPVQLTNGGAASVSFGNNVVGQLSGVVFNDLDGSGTPSEGEPGLGGVSIEVRNPDTGSLVASAITTGSGIYTVSALPPASYRITQLPVTGYVTPAPQATVTLAAGGAATANFANRAGATVSGRVFNDENGDGTRSPSEPGMGGVRIVLRRGGSTAAETLTAGDGTFLFTAVAPGEIVLEQTVPAGFHATTPASLTVSLAPGAALGAGFGNQSDSVRPPTVTVEPVDLVLADGSMGELKATVTGTPELLYQWLKNGTPLPGANGPSLLFNPARATDEGLYQLRIRNAIGTVLTRAARLTVTTGDPFTSWARGYSLASTSDKVFHDPDLDGLANLFEFVIGSHPGEPTPTGHPFAVELASGGKTHLGFELKRTRAASSVRIFLLGSDDLVRWSEVPSNLDVVQTGAQADLIRVSDAAPISDHPHRFLRLGMELSTILATPAKLKILSAPPLSVSFQLSLEGQAGTVYAIERSTDLSTWTFLQNVTAGASPVTIVDTDSAAGTHRFYRAVAR